MERLSWVVSISVGIWEFLDIVCPQRERSNISDFQTQRGKFQNYDLKRPLLGIVCLPNDPMQFGSRNGTL